MKKIFALMLCICLIFSFAACGKESTASDIEGVDVEYYAKLGKMPECDYILGGDVEKALKEMLDRQEAERDEDDTGHSHDGFYVNEVENDDFSSLQTGIVNYYYSTKNKASGFTHIVNFDTAFGFEAGTVSIEIKEAMKANGLESTERDVAADEFFFMPGAMGCSCLEYGFGDKSVVFIFQDNSLCATALFTTDI